jgi:hypothetical protein
MVLVGVHFGEEYKPTEIIGKDGAPMVLIPAGELTIWPAMCGNGARMSIAQAITA